MVSLSSRWSCQEGEFCTEADLVQPLANFVVLGEVLNFSKHCNILNIRANPCKTLLYSMHLINYSYV